MVITEMVHLPEFFAIDNKGNIVTSGKLNGNKDNNYNSILDSGSNNTIAGMTAAEKLSSTSGSTAIGSRAMMGKLNATPSATTAILGRDSALYARSEKIHCLSELIPEKQKIQ